MTNTKSPLSFNLHTHTTRCRHAVGADREYVEAAIRGGYRVLGFSDHAPMPFPDGRQSNYRVRLEECDDYVASVLALREEFRDNIEIHLGFEVEYYPAVFPCFLDFVSQYPYEYLILGQHFFPEETDHASGVPTDDPAALQLYLDTVLEGLETGRFLYLAHPDMIRFTGDDAAYAARVLPFLRRVKALGIPVEINRLGFADRRHYPCERFWALAGQVGNKAIVGVDAHAPAHLLDFPAIDGCLDMAARHGLSLAPNPLGR